MADTVVVRKIFESRKRVGYIFSGKSDGTGESAVQKIDISTLTADGFTPDSLVLRDISWSVSGYSYIELLWDRDTDVSIGVFSGQGAINYDLFGGINDTGTGGTGDILLTTSGQVSGGSYLIVTEWEKK